MINGFFSDAYNRFTSFFDSAIDAGSEAYEWVTSLDDSLLENLGEALAKLPLKLKEKTANLDRLSALIDQGSAKAKELYNRELDEFQTLTSIHNNVLNVFNEIGFESGIEALKLGAPPQRDKIKRIANLSQEQIKVLKSSVNVEPLIRKEETRVSSISSERKAIENAALAERKKEQALFLELKPHLDALPKYLAKAQSNISRLNAVIEAFKAFGETNPAANNLLASQEKRYAVLIDIQQKTQGVVLDHTPEKRAKLGAVFTLATLGIVGVGKLILALGGAAAIGGLITFISSDNAEAEIIELENEIVQRAIEARKNGEISEKQLDNIITTANANKAKAAESATSGGFFEDAESLIVTGVISSIVLYLVWKS
jgi:hypothetical protein